MTADDVLKFWIGELDEHGLPPEGFAQRWWQKDDDFDAEIRERFAPTFRACLEETVDWDRDPRGTLARVIVLDQLSRNAFRDQPKMYAGDGRARALAIELLDTGAHDALEFSERAFALMPLMHSESLDDQRRCEREFRALFDEVAGTPAEAAAENYVEFAKRHREIVERFGRFPHRNAILDRPSTPEEAAFLQQPGSSF